MSTINRVWERIRAVLGSAGPLTAQDRPMWEAARTLPDLGELTAWWLEGRIASQPGYYGPVDVDEDDAPGLTDTLIALNRGGLVTYGSQAGFDGHGYDGAHWRLHAAVCGFAAPDTARRLTAALAGTRFVIRQWGCKRGDAFTRTDRVGVTFREGSQYTSFGQLTDGVIAGELYPGCDDAAIDAVRAARQVTIYDPRAGDNELWLALRAATETRKDTRK